MSELLVPLMPLFATLPIAVAAAWIVHRVLRAREGGSALRQELEGLRQEIESLRLSQTELQERLDFTERVLAQLRKPERRAQASE